MAEIGLVPVDEAMTLAGLDPKDLYEWFPSHTLAAVPATPRPGVTYYDTGLLGVKVPCAPATQFAPEGVVPVEFLYTDSAEQIAERIRKALSKGNA